jgi:hypothetical protein
MDKTMKRIPVSWPLDGEVGASKVNIHISASDLRSHLNSILQKDLRGLSLIQLQKLNMEQLRQWQIFPARILRSL